MSDGMPGFVWVDGRVLPSTVPHLSVFDRGFQLGDGIFETLRARGGHVTIDPGRSDEVHDALIARRIVVDHRPGAGIRVAKHGSHCVSSACGSAAARWPATPPAASSRCAPSAGP